MKVLQIVACSKNALVALQAARTVLFSHTAMIDAVFLLTRG